MLEGERVARLWERSAVSVPLRQGSAARYSRSLSCVAGGFVGPLGISCSAQFPEDSKGNSGME